MITVWTIYDWPMTWSWVARRSIVDDGTDLIEDDDLGEHIKLSTDINALRDQLKILGFERVGRHPLDFPEIVEVWLKRNKLPTTVKRTDAQIQP